MEQLDLNSVRRAHIHPGAVAGIHLAQGILELTHVLEQEPCVGVGTAVPDGFVTTYQPLSDVLFVLAGTAYSTSVGVVITVSLSLDGTLIGSTSRYTNEANSHKTLPTVTMVARNVPSGLHEVTLAGSGTGFQVDTNDFFDVMAMELPIQKVG